MGAVQVTDIARKAYEMLTEDTGRHMLDSGGAYGRHWEQNRQHSIEEWCATPRAIIEGYAPSQWRSPSGGATQYYPAGYDVTLSTFHYLREWCGILPDSNPLHTLMRETEECDDGSWFDVAQGFADAVRAHGGAVTDGWNTANYEMLLTQVMQGFTVRLGDGPVVLCVQMHGGCDVRGGYTRPHLLTISGANDPDYAECAFLAGMQDADVYCTHDDCQWAFSIHGADIVTRDGDYSPDAAAGYCPERNPSGIHWDTLTCPECGTPDSIRADMQDASF